jgi:transposase
MIKLQDEKLYFVNYEEAVIKGTKCAIIHVKRLNETQSCPHCSSLSVVIKDYRIRTIKHHSFMGLNCIIKYHQRRKVCRQCNKVFNEFNTFVKPRQRLSNLVISGIMKECLEQQSFKSIAKKLNISHTSVINNFAIQTSLTRLTLTETICVDEFKGTTGDSVYCFILGDPVSQEIIDIVSSRRQDELEKYFKDIPQDERYKVKYVVIDLWDPYRSLFKFWLPKAKIIADRFHYTRILNDAFNSLRVKVMNQANKDKKDIDYYFLKKFWKVLMKYSESLEKRIIYCAKLKRNISTTDILDYCLNINDILAEAYYLRDKALKMFKYSTIDNIESAINDWFILEKQSIVREFDTVVNTYVNWKQEIINSFIINPKTGKKMSNGFIEGKNNFCKVVKRNAYGFKSFPLLRAKILYSNAKSPRVIKGSPHYEK